ncbi:MAG: molybdate ABC transporter permease subunit [Candidatus Vecturithrix sp.]|jgi:molybdate transport system permease protein|nr:molybdate ABC transporter permease subunit [Candidatus Vecturithrix sp.]
MDTHIWFSIQLSLRVATVATLFVALIGGVIAYFLATRQFRGKTFIEIVVTLPMILPPTVTGYYLILLLGRNGVIGRAIYRLTGWSLMFSWHGAVAAAFVVALPLMIKTAQAAIASLDRSMIDTAYVLGYSELQTAIKVMLPLARKGILAGVILSFARAMGEFGATLMLAGNIPGRTNTLPLAIYTAAASGDWPTAHVMVGLLTLMSGVFLFLVHKFGAKVS